LPNRSWELKGAGSKQQTGGMVEIQGEAQRLNKGRRGSKESDLRTRFSKKGRSTELDVGGTSSAQKGRSCLQKSKEERGTSKAGREKCKNPQGGYEGALPEAGEGDHFTRKRRASFRKERTEKRAISIASFRGPREQF